MPHVAHVNDLYGSTKELFDPGKVLFALGRVVLDTQHDDAPWPNAIGSGSDEAAPDHIGSHGKMRDHIGACQFVLHDGIDGFQPLSALGFGQGDYFDKPTERHVFHGLWGKSRASTMAAYSTGNQPLP